MAKFIIQLMHEYHNLNYRNYFMNFPVPGQRVFICRNPRSSWFITSTLHGWWYSPLLHYGGLVAMESASMGISSFPSTVALCYDTITRVTCLVALKRSYFRCTEGPQVASSPTLTKGHYSGGTSTDISLCHHIRDYTDHSFLK